MAMQEQHARPLMLQVTCSPSSEHQNVLISAPTKEPLSSTEVYWIKARNQLLLSNLQKAVRRRLTQVVLRTTQLLLSQDYPPSIVNALKRCIIIIAEDATLHPIVSHLTFFFLAVLHGWDLNQTAKSLILQGMASICEPHVPADWRCWHEFDRQHEGKAEEEKVDSSNKLEPREDLLLNSLAIRASYGGMSGDMTMLHYLYQKWSRRFHSPDTRQIPECWQRWCTGKWYNVPWPREMTTAEGWTFTRSDQLKEAVDHHCSSILVTLIKECNIPVADNQKLASLIWDRRSKLRARVCTCGLHINNELIDQTPIRGNDPSWWESAWRKIDRFSLHEWIKPSAASEEEQGGKKKSRQEILESQLNELENKDSDTGAASSGKAKRTKAQQLEHAKKKLKVNPEAFRSMTSFFDPQTQSKPV